MNYRLVNIYTEEVYKEFMTAEELAKFLMLNAKAKLEDFYDINDYILEKFFAKEWKWRMIK